MKFNLILFEGTDSIKFGMTSEEIQAILKIKPKKFKKSDVDLCETEDYLNICHVYYEVGKNGMLICAGFEFYKPSQVFLNNVQLIGTQRKDIEDLFNTEFSDYVNDVSGVTSKQNDISFYAPKKTITSVYIARKGYFNEQEEYYKTHSFLEKYGVSDEDDEAIKNDVNARKRFCPNCWDLITVTNGENAVCPKCNVSLL
ncbi:MAG: hypothetical protein N2645_21615 [Clostridia bacterium]|nr:hypothetical protein [Clostridia bacterium]